MSDWFKVLPPVERRAHPRYEILAQVRLRHGKVTHVMDVRDVSRSGLFVAAGDPGRAKRFHIGLRVEMDLFAAEDLENLRVTGLIVRRVDRGEPEAIGFGVQFVDVDEATGRALDRLVVLAATHSIRPPPLPIPPLPEDVL